MTSVISGDIIHSQKISKNAIMVNLLKDAFKNLGLTEKESNIYRGDSFQLEMAQAEKSFATAVYIKACVKTVKDLDVRLAIGIGEKTYQGQNVLESNGPAFVSSGETLESLKIEKQNLKIKTPHVNIDNELNLYFRLALIAMDHWTTNSAEVVKLYFESPNMLQKEFAEQLNISQNAVSKRQNRAHLDAILELDTMYKNKIKTII